MSEQDGARVTLAEVIAAHPGPLKVDSSGEHHGACPVCVDGTDRWWAAERDGTLIVQCRQCNASFADHLSALGLRQATNGAGLHIPPVLGSRREGNRRPAGTRRWRCVGPDGERVHARTDDGAGNKHIQWLGAGPGSKRLLYVVPGAPPLPPGAPPLPPGAPPLPLVVTEGEPDADAAAVLYGADVQVIGTVCGASSQPDRDVWERLGVKDRRVLLWPDADDLGAEHMRRIGAAILELGAASVRMVDPARLGLTGKGDGAADWRPPAGADVRAVLRDCSNEVGTDAAERQRESAAEREAVNSIVAEIETRHPTDARRSRVVSALERKGYGRADARRFAVAAVPDAPAPAGDKMPLLLDIEAFAQPPAILPGLLWAGLVSVLAAAPKAGKTTLLAHALAAVYSGGSFLGERGGKPDRPICLWTEMQPGMLASWVRAQPGPDECADLCRTDAGRRSHRSTCRGGRTGGSRDRQPDGAGGSGRRRRESLAGYRRAAADRGRARFRRCRSARSPCAKE